MSISLCKTDDLSENDVLAADVVTDDYQVLLSAGTRMRSELILKLEQMGIKEVRIESLDIDEIQGKEILKDEVREKVSSDVRNIIEKHVSSRDNGLDVMVEEADEIINDILGEEKVVDQVYDMKNRKADIYEHSVNLCALSTMISMKMNMPKTSTHDIAVGCLLHDIGFKYLSVEYENRYLKDMTMEEQIEYKTHPISGYEELKNESWLSDTSKSIVLSHHERLDGSGYPFKERDFSTECKIVQVCDEFDELISGIACKPTKVYEAVEYMKVYSGVKFDSQIVENLLAFTAVYPVGTVVRTNEGEEAIVLHQNLKFPDRPVIRIIRDKDGKEVAGFNIKDMLKIHTLFIEDAENF